jgi:hypothetical protein
MTPLDIIYTPLDIPHRPKIDLDMFRDWYKSTYPQDDRNLDPFSANAEKRAKDEYPWDLVYAYTMSHGWRNGFEEKFPELAKYCYNGFGIDLDDIKGIVILFLRYEKKGLGFWHMDQDPYGLRFYIDCESPDENPLLMRRTIDPHNVRPGFEMPMYDQDPRFDDEVLTCKIHHPNQAYYLNNIRSCHSPYINQTGTNRIAVLIGPKADRMEKVYNKIKNLIVDSAIKYKEYSLFWEKNG